jgi:hypothetical protein
MTRCHAALPLALLLALPGASPAWAQLPIVRGFTPEAGTTGRLVKIIGDHFDEVVAVDFGGVPSPLVRVVASQHLKAEVPEGAVSSPIGLLSRTGVRTTSARWFVVERPAVPRPPLAFATPSPIPSAGSVAFGFSIPAHGAVRLDILDAQGRLVRTLVDGDLGPGPHQRGWDGRDARGVEVTSGVFHARLDAAGARLVRRLVMVR